MAFNAALLDELMGLHRNVAPGEGRSQDQDWKDDEVCKYFLCGFCPSELFVNTRADVGQCDKLHDESLRTAYKNSGEEFKLGYEEDFLEYLQSIIRRLERRLERCHQRLDTSAQAKNKRVRPDANPEEVAKLNKEIEELLVQVEASGNTGEVDKAQELMVKVEMLKTEKERLLQKQPTIAGFDTGDDFHEKMEVCQDCGCFLVINDTPQRIQSHLEGKQHMGYVRIRSTIEELKKQLSEKQSSKVESRRDSAKSRETDRDRSHHRDSHHDGDRNRNRDRDGDHDGDRSRYRDRDRDRGRDRDRDHDKNRDRDRERDHHRSRDRDENHDGDQNRDRRSDRSRDGDRHRRSRDHSGDHDGDRHRSKHSHRESRGSRSGRSRSRSPSSSHRRHHRH